MLLLVTSILSLGFNWEAVSSVKTSDKSDSSTAHNGSSSSAEKPFWITDKAVSVPLYELIPYLKLFFNLLTSDWRDLNALNSTSANDPLIEVV